MRVSTRSFFPSALTGCLHAVLLAAPLCLAAQNLAVTEILASSGAGLADEDGDHPDWIEIQNLDTTSVEVGGWYLTDDPSNLKKWTLPALELAGGEYAVVFASGKDRAAPGQELHASFKLDAGGGYLALVKADGVTVASEFVPGYPPQREDVSYGVSQAVAASSLIADGAPSRFIVPASGDLTLAWTTAEFDDAAWTAARIGMGYDVEDRGGDPPPGEISNLALAGTATQSTIGYGGLPERANDGNTDGNYGGGSVSHTADGDPLPSWEVDLGGPFTLARVVLWNRTDCCAGRLSNFRVSVFEDPEAESFAEDFFTDGLGFPPPGTGFEIPLPGGTRGRFVRVEVLGPNATGQTYLSLAEVEVLGTGSAPTGPANLAKGKVATQSTTAFAGFASRAVDGNTGGVFGDNSVTHTSPTDPQPSWQVDLGAAYGLDRAVLWNRTDCCAERLSNLRVSVLDEAMRIVTQSDHFTDKSFPVSQDYSVPFPPGTRGRFVTIAKLGPDSGGENVLSLAEVEVWSAPPGYRGAIRTDVEGAMHGVNASLYLRIPFEAADPAAFGVLKLRARYDDGFVAYLNGREVARRNSPAEPAWSSSATAEHRDVEALAAEEINISSHIGALRPGRNVLAVQALNVSRDDADFLIVPELEAVSFASGALRYFEEPTPGAPNDKPGFLGFVADTKFSADRGFFNMALDVAITTETAGAEIRYTLDGTAPAQAAGTLYTGPIHVTTTTTLRAAAFKAGFRSTNADAQTYIFPADVVKQTGAGFPASWGGTPADYAMDPNVVGNPRYSRTIHDDITSRIPTLSISMDVADIFGPRGIYSSSEGRGDAWEKPCSVELIRPDGSPGWQVNCGVRVFGYGWRSHSASMKHALRLMFKRKYGPAKLERRFFPDFPVERFDDIVLRSQGSRSWNDFRTSIEQTCYIRDAWARYTERDMGKLGTSSTYVHLYLNGLYWGLYNPVERPDAEFLAEHLGGSEEDYDALNARVGQLEVIDGSRAGWDALVALARSSAVTTLEGYTAIRESLDSTDLIDYLLINFYTGNQDWVGSNGNNMRVAGAPALGVGYKAFCWDMEYSIWNATDNVLNVLAQYDTPAALYARLKLNPEFRLDFADRVRRHFFHGGALTPGRTAERWLDRAAEIDRAVVGESARWGDRRREPPYTRDVEWVRERDRLTKSYFPQRTGILLSQLRQAGLYPGLDAPEFNQHGGAIPRGFALEISAPAGTILFTLDGSDPRLEGGAAAPGARAYESPVILSSSTLVKARALDGAAWSALTEAAFLLDVPPALRITEVHYHPEPPAGPSGFAADDFEFLELKNTGPEPLDLAGFRLVEGVAFDFSAGSVKALAPGGFVLVVEDIEAFAARYGTAGLDITGEYSGQLSNAGERLRLEGPFGETILDFAYDDAWYEETDGLGPSLEVIDPRKDPPSWNEATSWQPSRSAGGSPGRDGSQEPDGGLQTPGDANQDARIDLSDAVALLGHLFLGSPAVLPCGDGTLPDAANRQLLDSSGDGRVDLTDAVFLLSHLFLGGLPPALGSECVRIAGCPPACNG